MCRDTQRPDISRLLVGQVGCPARRVENAGKLAAVPGPRRRMARCRSCSESATPQIQKAEFLGGILGNRRHEFCRSRMASHGQRIEVSRPTLEVIA
jgi:hypothetical protein